jgi:dynein heavy chain
MMKDLKKTQGYDFMMTKFSPPKKFAEAIQYSVVNGKNLIIEDAGETLDSSIDNILGKQYFKDEGRTLIKFGSEKLDYHKDFKLFITTKLSNPHYLPEIFIKVTVINFTVT